MRGGEPGPTVETARLLLRPPVEADLDAWAAMAADAEVMRFLGGPQPRAVAWRGLATIAGCWALRGHGFFSVIERDSGRWLGRVGPWHPEGWPGTEIAWSLSREAWGRGYAREAAEAAMRWAVDTLGWERIVHTIAPGNARSIRVAEALGSRDLGPCRLPPPYADQEVRLWGQEAGARRPG